MYSKIEVFSHIGTSLWWYGYYQMPFSGPTTSAAFSIDGSAPSKFSVPNPDSFSTSQAYLFRTPVLENAKHFLTVVFHGHNESNPLTLQTLLIQRSVLETPPPSSTEGVLPSTTIYRSPSLQKTSKDMKIGDMIGGIAGGVVFLILIGSGLYALLRWKRRLRLLAHMETPVGPEPFPLLAGGSVRIHLARKARESQENIPNPLMRERLQEPPLTKWTRRILPRYCSSSTNTLTRGHSMSTVNLPLLLDESQLSLGETNAVNRQSLAHPEIPFHQDSLNTIILEHVPRREGEREEDSGLRMACPPILPPVYTMN